jgi:serine/threonine-protein kinase RsbW
VPESLGQDGFDALFPSAYRSVAEARHAVADYAIDCGFDYADVCDIALAVGEACNNAAEHGHVVSGHFRLGATFDGVDLSIVVADSGAGFDPRQVPGTIKRDMMDRGMGIFLMRALMDRVEHDCTGDGTTVRLVKRRRLR